MMTKLEKVGGWWRLMVVNEKNETVDITYTRTKREAVETAKRWAETYGYPTL